MAGWPVPSLGSAALTFFSECTSGQCPLTGTCARLAG
ncbi:DUF6132 family protein [Pannonibacter indicus]